MNKLAFRKDCKAPSDELCTGALTSKIALACNSCPQEGGLSLVCFAFCAKLLHLLASFASPVLQSLFEGALQERLSCAFFSVTKIVLPWDPSENVQSWCKAGPLQTEGNRRFARILQPISDFFKKIIVLNIAQLFSLF